MKQSLVRFKILFAGILICLFACDSVQAGDSIKSAGDVLLFVLPATAAGLTLGFRDSKGALQLGESLALTLAATYGLKYTVNETRPNGGEHSFPSGHSSITFTTAEFIRKRYGWEYGIPAYATASFVAYSRVKSKQHYTHDVIAGAAIGIGSAYLFTRPYEGWRIQAGSDPGYYGISLSRSW